MPQPSERAPRKESADVSETSRPKSAVGEGNEPAETAALPARMLGEYRLLRRLGRGGMAEVYLAEQTSLKRNVAIKVLRKERVTDEVYLKRFKTEAMAAAALSHPNIVNVYAIGEHEGTHYIVQEYVQGMNLRDLLVRKGPPDAGAAVHIMRQVARALEAAHAAGIVHRDIKPENIMITRKADVKVADFGLAQLTQQGQRLNLTDVGMTMGTPLYMSPEQVSGSKLDARSDLYSLGVTSYHMLSGSPPFRGETALSVAVQHLKQKPESLEEIRPDLPKLLCRIVHKMLAKKPDERYQSATAVLRDLKKLGELAEPEAAARGAEESRDEVSVVDRIEGNFFARGVKSLWRAPDRSLARYAWGVILFGLLVGGASAGIGWVLREPDPFAARSRGTASVENKGTAARQYFYAMTLRNDIPAWKAVVDYYPADRLHRMLALKQLATLHLEKREYDEAEKHFEELATTGGSESGLKAFGQAGLAVIQYVRGEYQNSQATIAELAKSNGYRDLDLWMRGLVADTIRRNQRHLQEDLANSLKRLLDDAEQAPGPGEPRGDRPGGE
jgi:serine/threonine-protein kinase